MRLEGGSATDVGRVRKANEDGVFVGTEVFAVADGMGGHRGGEVASATALAAFSSVGSIGSSDGLLAAVDAANRAVFDQSVADPFLSGMGTTLVGLAAIAPDASGGDRVAVVNVGDSRVYLLSGDEFVQLSEDHSLIETMVRTGQITEAEAVAHPRRNVITRALGIESVVEIDAWVIQIKPGDRFLLCSDGLFNELSDDQMIAILRRDVSPREAAWELVRLANESGGRDNISAVVVDVVDSTAAIVADVDFAADAVVEADTIAERLVRVTEPADEIIIRTDTMEYSATPSPVFADAPAPVIPSHADADAGPTNHGSGSRWRVWMFIAAIVAIAGVGAVATVTVARSGFYLTDNGTEVQLYQGRREGLLWFHPTLVEATGVLLADLREADRAIIDQQTFTSRQEATARIDELRAFSLENRTTTTLPTTSTTTSVAGDASSTTTSVTGP